MFQVGVENIGSSTSYMSVEVISLAVQSLALISSDAVLDLSHTGYVDGLLASLPIEEPSRRVLRTCIDSKNAHELRDTVPKNLTESDLERLQAVARLSGPLPDALDRAIALAKGPEMITAVEELRMHERALSALGLASTLRLDFSITSNAKYYNGLMMRGYIDGVPGVVLSGGQYGPLLHRMGKSGASAIGFAIYFDELARYFSAEEDSAVETVILYQQDADPVAVASAVQACILRGERVWAGTELPKGLTWSQLVEVTYHA